MEFKIITQFLEYLRARDHFKYRWIKVDIRFIASVAVLWD